MDGRPPMQFKTHDLLFRVGSGDPFSPRGAVASRH